MISKLVSRRRQVRYIFDHRVAKLVAATGAEGSAGESVVVRGLTVVLPEALDQFLNAATLVELDAGAQPDEPLDGANLRCAVESALSEACRARVLRSELRREPGGCTISPGDDWV